MRFLKDQRTQIVHREGIIQPFVSSCGIDLIQPKKGRFTRGMVTCLECLATQSSNRQGEL